MTLFNAKTGAIALAAFGLIYLVASVATGRSATAHYPLVEEVDTSKLALSPWQVAERLIRSPAETRVIDVRSEEGFMRYSVPMSESIPNAEPQQLATMSTKTRVVVIAETNEKATTLIANARLISRNKNIFYLQDGAGGWYLKFEMPVSLFTDQAPPIGYDSALKTVEQYFTSGGQSPKKTTLDALAALIRLGYEPRDLNKKSKPKSSGKKRKKIAGGCG